MQMENRTAELSDRVFSAGHSNHEWDRFLALLHGAAITAIADVRSSPYSKRWPQFSKRPLEDALQANGIRYVYLGDCLGGRPASRDLYDADGRADYEKVRATPAFQRGLERLLHGAERYCVAMLCSEDDPLDCHRGLMITPALVELGVSPRHLRKDGSLETTAALELRLLKETRLEERLEADLFHPAPDAAEVRALMAEAYRLMAKKKAFQLQSEESDA
jgi:uncharacterized protein (DUF488 family)